MNETESEPPECLEETQSGISSRELSTSYLAQRDITLQKFESWTETDQVDFIENLLLLMCHYQHGLVNEFLTPMLQRDFITLLPSKSS